MNAQRILRVALLPAVLFGLAAVAPREATAKGVYMKQNPDGSLSFTDQPNGGKLIFKSKSESKTAAQYSPRPFGGGGPDRYTRYDDIIRDAAGYYQLPEAFVRAIIKVESDFDPTALSVAGAQGLTQLMPETAARMLVTDTWDPRENIFGGCRYLRVLANTFNGDLDLTIAAYNAGEGAVIRSGGIPNIAETQDYVVKVKSWYRRYRASTDPMEASVGSPGAD
jgi:hypothetical protein